MKKRLRMFFDTKRVFYLAMSIAIVGVPIYEVCFTENPKSRIAYIWYLVAIILCLIVIAFKCYITRLKPYYINIREYIYILEKHKKSSELQKFCLIRDMLLEENNEPIVHLEAIILYLSNYTNSVASIYSYIIGITSFFISVLFFVAGGGLKLDNFSVEMVVPTIYLIAFFCLFFPMLNGAANDVFGRRKQINFLIVILTDIKSKETGSKKIEYKFNYQKEN